MATKVVSVGDAGYTFMHKLYPKRRHQQVELIALNTLPFTGKSLLADDYYVFADSGGGSGGNPMIGREYANNSKDDLYHLLADTDHLILTAGMGGGTGSGAVHVVAYIARELHIPTSAVVSTPFSFEGQQRAKIAKLGIQALRKFADDVEIVEGLLIEDMLNNRRNPPYMGISLPITTYYDALQFWVHFQLSSILENE